MIINYWTHANWFAKLRSRFCIPNAPKYATLEEWDQYNDLKKSISPGFVRFEDTVDKTQRIVEEIISFPHSIKYFLNNAKTKTHMLRTTHGKFGQWMDFPQRMEDALFTGVIDFVEIECAANYDSSLDDEFTFLTEAEKGIAYIRRYEKFQNEREPEDEMDYTPWIESATKLLSLYNFAKEYFDDSKDPYEIAKNEKGAPDRNSPGYKNFIERYGVLEKEREANIKKNLLLLVEIKDSMWT